MCTVWLCRQTYDVIIGYTEALKTETKLPNPELRSLLCIGEPSAQAATWSKGCSLNAAHKHGISLILSPVFVSVLPPAAKRQEA